MVTKSRSQNKINTHKTSSKTAEKLRLNNDAQKKKNFSTKKAGTARTSKNDNKTVKNSELTTLHKVIAKTRNPAPTIKKTNSRPKLTSAKPEKIKLNKIEANKRKIIKIKSLIKVNPVAKSETTKPITARKDTLRAKIKKNKAQTGIISQVDTTKKSKTKPVVVAKNKAKIPESKSTKKNIIAADLSRRKSKVKVAKKKVIRDPKIKRLGSKLTHTSNTHNVVLDLKKVTKSTVRSVVTINKKTPKSRKIKPIIHNDKTTSISIKKILPKTKKEEPVKSIIKNPEVIPSNLPPEPRRLAADSIPITSSISDKSKRNIDRWSECGQIFYTHGKAFGIAPNLRTIYIGTENDIHEYLLHGKYRDGLTLAQRIVLDNIKEYHQSGQWREPINQDKPVAALKRPRFRLKARSSGRS